MADRENQKKKPAQRTGRGAKTRPPRKMKVTESGKPEQPPETAGREPSGERPAGAEAVREIERREFQHGGIPIGSDPRE
jgi:hypothetical protein